MKLGISYFLFLIFSLQIHAQEKVPLALVIKTVPDATDDGYYFELPKLQRNLVAMKNHR